MVLCNQPRQQFQKLINLSRGFRVGGVPFVAHPFLRISWFAFEIGREPYFRPTRLRERPA